MLEKVGSLFIHNNFSTHKYTNNYLDYLKAIFLVMILFRKQNNEWENRNINFTGLH